MLSILDAAATTLLTYASHSFAACLLALIAARWLHRPQDRELLWKAALVAPLLSATTVVAATTLGLRGAFVDLGMIVRRVAPVSLPGRKVFVRIMEDDHGQTIVRQFTDPVTTGLSIVAVAIALCCCAIALSRLVYRRLALRRALAGRQKSDDSIQLANGRVARVSTAADLASPVALGSREVCLPTEVAEQFTDQHRRVLLEHEAAHLVRRDPLWFGAVEAIGALSAFQPLTWRVIRAFRRDVELICDEAAVRATGDGAALVGALALLASPYDPRSPLHGAATAHDGSPLIARAERIATLGHAEKSRGWRYAAIPVVIALIALLCAVPAVSSAPRLSDYPPDPRALLEGMDGARSVHSERNIVLIRARARVVRRELTDLTRIQ